jgi:hypothetical protein
MNARQPQPCPDREPAPPPPPYPQKGKKPAEVSVRLYMSEEERKKFQDAVSEMERRLHRGETMEAGVK